jgi:phage shock protein A
VAIATVAAIVAVYNKAENAAKKAEKSAKAAQEQYEKVRTQYEELKTTISDYTKERDALDTMIKGTDAWKESIA